jgi:prostaglandin-endoperoxide synthase 2
MPNVIWNLLIDLANNLSKEFLWIRKIINKLAINRAVNVARYRPHPWSTKYDYACWASLSDKRWSARHLPANNNLPANQVNTNPPLDKVVALFRRPVDKPLKLCSKSTCLFPAFAQYLTDGFIRTRMPNKSKGESDDGPLRKQNTSNHDIDLSPLYGRTEEQTHALRLKSQITGGKGKLKSQRINGEEYAPFLFENDIIKQEYKCLDMPLKIDHTTPEMRQTLFAFGGDRANTSPQIAAMNTLFLREHNRLAGAIESSNPTWDDDRVFETARNTTIVVFIKVVVEEYINHISGSFNQFLADPSVAWYAPWNKPNWITTEFSLLYRWHQLIPDSMRWDSKNYPVHQTILNNVPLLETGIKQTFIDLSDQAAGKIGAFNTAAPLLDFEAAAISQGRLCKLTSYNDYREYVSLPRLTTFSEISKNDDVVNLLKNVYGTIDDVEFYVGLFADDADENDILPPVIGRLVAVDAFSQALTNPLLSRHVFKEETFSSIGWNTINQTKNLRAVVSRNINSPLTANDFVGMTRKGWKRK